MINRSTQSGITVTGLIFGGMLLVVIAVFGLKVVPEVLEYAKIRSNIVAVAKNPALKQASVAEVRKAYELRAIVDHTSAISAQDVEVTRDGNTLILSFAYTKRIHLGGPVSLLIDFEASSDQ